MATADLETTSAKSIRRQLEKEFNTNLNDIKRAVDKLIMKILEEMPSEADESGAAATEQAQTSMTEVADSGSRKRDRAAAARSETPPDTRAAKRKPRKKPEKRRILSSDVVFSDDEDNDEMNDGSIGGVLCFPSLFSQILGRLLTGVGDTIFCANFRQKGD
ncbi:hypothetical protein HK104_000137 [Borealophlyctis nickersoniae]|nr:hypothetical protein HK104_000137 [Borealophlyctis nickersoniae]